MDSQNNPWTQSLKVKLEPKKFRTLKPLYPAIPLPESTPGASAGLPPGRLPACPQLPSPHILHSPMSITHDVTYPKYQETFPLCTWESPHPSSLTRNHHPLPMLQTDRLPIRALPPSRILPTICNFCKGNGESALVYTSHSLRDEYQSLTCPVLRSYVCPQCGGTGDTAHTLSYCPWTKELSVAKAIRKKTGRNSAGQLKPRVAW